MGATPAPEGPTEEVPKVEAELGLAELPEPAVADMEAFTDLPDGKFGVFTLAHGGKGFRHVKTHTETMEQKDGQGMELITDTVDGKTTQKNYDIKNGKLVPVKRPANLTKMQEEKKKTKPPGPPPPGPPPTPGSPQPGAVLFGSSALHLVHSLSKNHSPGESIKSNLPSKK